MHVLGRVRTPDALNISQSYQSGLQRCMSFIEYPDKHGMSGARMTLFKIFSPEPTNIHREPRLDLSTSRQPSTTLLNYTPPHSLLPLLIAKAALSTAGITGSTFRKQERECEGFASELLRQIRLLLKESQDFRSTDPFNREGSSN